MRTSPILAAFLVSTGLHLAALAAGNGVVDLTALANYANQTRPTYIVKNNTPPDNQLNDRVATLGRVLFYDKRLSRNDTVSCSSCHQQAHGFADGSTASAGVAGTTGRHSMRLINERFSTEPKFFWDERAATLEAQTSQPIQNHVEMGFSNTLGDPALTALVTKLSALDDYRVLFTGAFGDPAIDETRLQKALAQFVRSIQSFDSKYDVGRAQSTTGDVGPFVGFTAAENAGKALFLNPPAPPGPNRGAGCAGCHRPPEFDIDPNSLNNGVVTQIGGGTDTTNTRSPSLRDLIGPGNTPNGPFMHDGSKQTLLDVITHYDAVPQVTNLDRRLQRPPLNLTLTEKNNLVAFLSTLTGKAVYTDVRWSDPFDAQGRLALVVLPAQSITLVDNGNGTATVSSPAVRGVRYQLRSSTDMINWSTVTTVTGTQAGICSATVPIVSGLYYRFTYVPTGTNTFTTASVTLASVSPAPVPESASVTTPTAASTTISAPTSTPVSRLSAAAQRRALAQQRALALRMANAAKRSSAARR